MPRSSSVPKAVTASRSCIFLAQSIKDVIPSSHWLAFFSQYLFSSAIIILLCVMRATDQEAVNTAMNEVGTAIECLGTLEALWPGARKCKEILKELADITLSKVRDTVGVPSPTKRDRLTVAAENILAGSQSPLSKAFITTPNVSLANQSPTGVHTRPIGMTEFRSYASKNSNTFQVRQNRVSMYALRHYHVSGHWMRWTGLVRMSPDLAFRPHLNCQSFRATTSHINL